MIRRTRGLWPRGADGRLARRTRRLVKRLRRLVRPYVYRLRWEIRSIRRPPARFDPAPGEYGLERCDVVFINLDSREDRRRALEAELRSIGVSDHRRFPAIAAEVGLLGCGRSHHAVLSSWDPAPGRILLVLEDDCEFIGSREEIDAAIEEFARDPWLEAVCLAYRVAWEFRISPRLAISADIATMACYAVKPSVVPELARVIDEGNRRLAAGEPAHSCACDVVWETVQRRRFFAIPRERLARQRPGFSDIELSWTDYGV